MSAAVRMPDPELVRCARCGEECPTEAWRARPTDRTLTGAELGACVVAWPADTIVEVRGCPRCGASIARRRRL